MKTYMIIGEVDKVERTDLENCEATEFKSYDDLLNKFDSKDVMIMELSDFVDAINNQEMDVLTESWVSYVYVK